VSKPLAEIEGFAELLRKIKTLKDDKVKRREVLKILRQVATPTVKAAKSEAPVSKEAHYQGGKRTKKRIEPKNLQRSIGKILGKRGRAKINPVLYVGPRSKGRKYDGWYGGFVHGGTVKQKANPFMERAYKTTKAGVTRDAEAKVARYIQKQIDRLSR
jgi:HK97 gp10 family phage protein